MANPSDPLPHWILIQIETFTNWLNHELRETPIRIQDLQADLQSGVALIRVVERLQKRACTGRVYTQDPTEIQRLMNTQMALDALHEDGVKTVNIGSQDIVGGNLKLILGLVWAVIQRYQIARSTKIPPKKLILAYLQAVLPDDLRISNFGSCWNDGRALSALINYCHPGLLADWRSLDRKNGQVLSLANCQRALETAEVELGIPPILSAQHLSSTHLDQNSCLAYLSFFTRENGPAFHATLAHVQNLVDDIRIRDFGSSWSDGHLLCRLVTAVGGCISAFEKDEMVYDRTHWTWNCRQALDAAVDLGVVPLVGADEIADAHNDDHIGLMALCAALCSLSPVPLRSEKAAVVHTSCLQHQQLNLDLAFAERSELDVEDLTIVVIGPNGPIDEAELPISKQKTEHGAVLSFVPHLLGAYRVHIFCEEVELSTSPIALEVLPAPTAADEQPEDEMSDFFEGPPIGQVSFSGLSEPCSIGSVVEVVINAQGGEAAGEVEVLSISPNGTQHQCEVIHRANFFTAIFKPEEIGDWKIHILYDKEPIRGSPFSCQVFDAERVSVQGLDVGLVNRELKFVVDASRAGTGVVKVSVFRDEHSIPCSVVEEIGGRNRYKVRFTPEGPGKDYRIHIFFNDMEIKGSPFILDIADASNVSVHGDELKAAVVGRPATFFVQATGAELKDVNVVITDPNDRRKQAKITPADGAEGRFGVEWRPQMVGEHLIDVQVYEQSVQDPFVCNVGDPARVTVSRVPNWIDVDGLNRDLSFEVDAVEGGVGELELLINGGRVTCRVRELSKRRFLATFTPTEAVPHTIEMKFNGHQVRGSPWKIPLRGATVFTSPKSQLTSALPQSGADQFSELVGLGLHRAQVGEIAYFDITTSSGQLKPADVDVRLEDPNGRPVETRVLPLRSALRCEFSIRQVGDHRLEVRINGRLIDSGPLTVAGFDLHKVRVQPVRANGVGNPAQFTVDASEAGKGALEISINQGRVPNNVQLQDAGRCLVTFIPQHAGTYVIDVTFNGATVHGCPIRVDVNAKGVGKPVSAPVVHPHRFEGHSAGVAGSTSPRPPSSAYFSAGSPHVDTSPTSPAYQTRESPRSPSLVAAHTRDRSSDQEERNRAGLRSPRLVHDANTTVGYTVAHYGEGKEQQSPAAPPADAPRRYFGDPTDLRDAPPHSTRTDYRGVGGESTVDSGLGSYSATSPRPHRYFESDVRSSPREPEWRRSGHEPAVPTHPPPPPEDSTQVEMTRSAEVRLYRDAEGATHPTAVKTQGITTYTSPKSGEVPAESGFDYRVTSDSSALRPQSREHHRRYESPAHYSAPRGEPRPDYAEPPTEETALLRTDEIKAIPLDAAVDRRPVEEESTGSKHKRLPSGAGSLTPGTRRKLLEHSVERSADLKESSFEYQSESDSRSSKPTTPRLSLKFGSSGRSSRTPGRGFEFGKSKFTSKHEVVRLGKDVEVKLESLKLGKEDQLRVVVTPPSRGRATDDTSTLAIPDLPHRLKKSGKTYEITFKPTEVGTHKVLAFVNDQPHPAAPFPIRVYDASRIIVGEIPAQSVVNDTVEFTADAAAAGFGVLEIAIKDANNIIIPSHVNQLESGMAKFLVTFNPSNVGVHSVNISFNKEQIANSPFRCNIVEAAAVGGAGGFEPTTPESRKKEKAKEKERKAKKDRNGLPNKPLVSKLPSLSRVGKPAAVLVQLPNSADLIQATIVDSTKQNCPAEIFEEEANVRRIEFVPQAVGDHEIALHVNGTEVAGSPFTCRAYDPAAILVGQIPDGMVNKPVHFTVDASSAGVGNLEVAVNDGKIPSQAQALGQHKYDISFIPRENIDHFVSVRFNNEPVEGSPFVCHLLGTQQMRVRAAGAGLDRVAVGRAVDFAIEVDDARGSAGVLPQVTITDAKGARLPVAVSKDVRSSDPNGTRFIAEYTPKTVGNHQVDVAFDGQPIGGSPFSVKAFDASCVRLSLGEPAVVGQPCTFIVDAARAGAGSMELIVSVQDRNVPNFVQAEGQARFKVSFTPQEARDHVISVKFNGINVPGTFSSSPCRSPLVCPVLSADSAPPPLPTSPPPVDEELRLVGDLAVAQVGRPKGFSIDAPRPNVDCNVIVTGPGKREIPVEVVRVSEGFDVEFTPRHEGDHQIDIRVDGRSLAICPIVCRVSPAHDSTAVPEVVKCGQPVDLDLQLGHVQPNEEVRVEVRAGDGAVVPCSSDVDRRKGRVRVGFTISKPGRYSVILRRNGAIVEEHFLAAEPADSNNVAFLSFPERALVDRTARFELELADGLEERLVIEVTDPDGNSVPVSLHRTSGRTFAVDWNPKREGPHVVNVRVAGEAVAEAPREVRVLDLTAVQLVGLQNAPVGVQQRFNIDWGQSGGSNTTVKVTYGDNKTVPCQMRRLKNGVDACSFVPAVPGLYLVDVAIDGITLPECPYECMIRDSGSVRALGDALNGAQCGRTARFEVVVGNANQGELDVTITDPHGSPLPVRCYKQQDNSYWVEFTPEAVGPHVIEATFGDAPLPGSPFHCEVVDPRRVAVHGLDDHLTLRHIAHVTVNRRNAGSGNLEFEIVDPNGVPLKVDRLKNSVDDDSFTFLPIRLGPHSVRLQLAGFPVPGVPKSVDVEEAGRLALQGPAIERAVEVGQPAALLLDTRRQAGGLKIDVRDPDGEKVRHTTNKRADNSTEIVFSPSRVGTHRVAVDFNNKPLGGSPYSVEIVDPRKVLVDDENTREDGGLLLAAAERNAIDVDATAAGVGQLRAEVRDPRGELLRGDEARVESPGRGKFRLLITPRRAGTYKIFLTFADHPVPSANPLLAHVEQGRAPSHGRVPTPKESKQEVRTTYASSSHTSFDSTTDHTRVRAYGDGLSRAIVKEPAEFFVDATNAPQAKVTATLNGEKADVPVRLTSVGPHLFKGVYTPLVGGPYELHVSVDERPVRDSPFRVHVQSFKTPAELIEVDARTLKVGILGEDVKTIIDARKATAGHLSAQCEGPSQLEYCELFDNRDGTYILRVTPKELGKHTLHIKYENEDVPGSPYVFSVHNPPDPTKVRVFGPGIEHGILAKFESNFVVDTRGAGAGQLTVRVRGPKGAFNVEMQRDRQQDRTIHCKYEPKEPGDYQVEVKWHGEHVNGSPFLVLIVDTEEELRRFLSGGAPSPPPALPFLPPGWQGPPHPPMMGGPPMIGPPLIPSLYGPVPASVLPPANSKGRRSAPPGMPPPQAIYGRAPRHRF